MWYENKLANFSLTYYSIKQQRKERICGEAVHSHFTVDDLPYGQTCTIENDLAKKLWFVQTFFSITSCFIESTTMTCNFVDYSLLHRLHRRHTNSVCLYTIVDTHDRKHRKELKHGNSNLFENILSFWQNLLRPRS